MEVSPTEPNGEVEVETKQKVEGDKKNENGMEKDGSECLPETAESVSPPAIRTPLLLTVGERERVRQYSTCDSVK